MHNIRENRMSGEGKEKVRSEKLRRGAGRGSEMELERECGIGNKTWIGKEGKERDWK